ncbi:transcriptional regulator, partial [Streptomyces sp. NTH33]
MEDNGQRAEVEYEPGRGILHLFGRQLKLFREGAG